MAAKRDYYEVLGVSRDASLDQIKKAYRQLALKHHPDRNQGDKGSEELFKEASEAYSVLSDQDNRAKYDRFGHAAFSGGGGFEGFGDFSGFAEDIFGDLFGAFFGNAGGQSRRTGTRRGGRDLRFGVEITLEEAANGVEKELEVPKPIPCESCGGTGARKGTSAETCRHCGGSGQLRIQQGFFTISRPCGSCNGKGTVIPDPCPNCGGNGQATKVKKLSVKIPAGIDHGQRLKIRGEGEEIRSGAPGDLFVEIALKPHPLFKRQETEILCEVPITYAQAVLGVELEVPTLNGKASVKIPPGTPSGKTFRLRSKGIVDMHTGQRGDQHVRTYIHVPKEISQRQRELLEELASIEGTPAANESRSFFDKVKEFFD